MTLHSTLKLTLHLFTLHFSHSFDALISKIICSRLLSSFLVAHIHCQEFILHPLSLKPCDVLRSEEMSSLFPQTQVWVAPLLPAVCVYLHSSRRGSIQVNTKVSTSFIYLRKAFAEHCIGTYKASAFPLTMILIPSLNLFRKSTILLFVETFSCCRWQHHHHSQQHPSPASSYSLFDIS